MKTVCTPGELSELIDDLESGELLTAGQVAIRLNVTEKEILRWAGECILPAQHVGGQWIFHLSDVARWTLTGLECLVGTAELSGEVFGGGGEIG